MNKEIISIELLESYWNTHKDKFEQITSNMNYQQCGVWFTEAFLFCSINDILKADLILESGTAWGQSTEIFANYFTDIPIITCDTGGSYHNWQETADRLSKYTNITCINGNSYHEFPKILDTHSKLKIAVFIDGPKNADAINLRNSLRVFNNVITFSFHDIGYDSIKVMLPEYVDLYHSHDINFIIKNYLYLNEKILKLDPSQKVWLPYGPSIAVEIV